MNISVHAMMHSNMLMSLKHFTRAFILFYCTCADGFTHESVKLTHESADRVLGMRTVKHEWGVNCDWRCR